MLLVKRNRCLLLPSASKRKQNFEFSPHKIKMRLPSTLQFFISWVAYPVLVAFDTLPDVALSERQK